MKKSVKKSWLLLMVLVFAISMMTACGKDEGATPTTAPTTAPVDEGNSTPETKEYSVFFYDGDSESVLLKEMKVKEGETVADPALVKEGYMVAGYYSTPALVREFDFTVKVTRDTKVFVAWKSSVVDERAWMLAGGLSAYPKNNWGKAWPQDDFLLQPVDGEFNTFSITVNLYKGDEFKIAVIDQDYVWDDTATLTSMMLADQTTGQLTSGNDAFDTGANIKVMEDGQYKLTIVTDAETLALCKLFYERVADAPKASRPTTWYMLGSGSSVALSASNWGNGVNPVLEAAGENVYSATLDLLAGDEFCVCSDSSWANKHFMTAEDDCFTNPANILVGKDGNYTITLTLDPTDPEKDTLTYVRNGEVSEIKVVTSVDYYIKGSKITAWADSREDAHHLTGADGVFTLTADMYANDEFLLTSVFNYADGTSSTGTTYVKYSNIKEGAEFVTDNGGNMLTVADGTYTFTYEEATESLKIAFTAKALEVKARPTTWYALGNSTVDGSDMKASNWGAGTNPQLALVEGTTNTYYVELKLEVGDEFQICADSSWGEQHNFAFIKNDVTELFEGTGNIKALQAGTYGITLTVGATIDDDTLEIIKK